MQSNENPVQPKINKNNSFKGSLVYLILSFSINLWLFSDNHSCYYDYIFKEIEETWQTGSFSFLFRQHELLSSIPPKCAPPPKHVQTWIPSKDQAGHRVTSHPRVEPHPGRTKPDRWSDMSGHPHPSSTALVQVAHLGTPVWGIGHLPFSWPPFLPRSSYYTSVLITSCICPPILPLNLPTQGLLLWQVLSTTTNLLEVNGLNPQFLTAGSSTKVNNMSLESGTPGLEVSLCLLMKWPWTSLQLISL